MRDARGEHLSSHSRPPGERFTSSLRATLKGEFALSLMIEQKLVAGEPLVGHLPARPLRQAGVRLLRRSTHDADGYRRVHAPKLMETMFSSSEPSVMKSRSFLCLGALSSVT